MKDSKALLLEYLASIRDPERAASLFADDGVFELPSCARSGSDLATPAGARSPRSFTGCSNSIRTSRSRRRTSMSSSRRRKRRSPSMWRMRAPLRPGERSISCSLGTWWQRPVRSSCCAKPSIRWRWRRRNCRTESPTSDHPATRCTLSDRVRADSPKSSVSRAGPVEIVIGLVPGDVAVSLDDQQALWRLVAASEVHLLFDPRRWGLQRLGNRRR
jgi:hypothetical protein